MPYALLLAICTTGDTQSYKTLLAEGFEPAEEDLWIRDGVWFGRGAALQQLWRTDAPRR